MRSFGPLCLASLLTWNAPAHAQTAGPDEVQAPAESSSVNATAPRRGSDRGRWAVSPTGGTGLIRTGAANSVDPGLIRLSLGVDFFSSSGFLRESDEVTRFGGILSLSGSPIDYLELWLNVRLASVDSTITEPNLLQTQGDLGFGLKGFYPVAGIFSVGADFQLDVLSSVGGSGFGAIRFQPRLLTTFDLQKLSKPVPLRFHFNAGYILDNSNELQPEGTSLTLAEQFALGIGEFDRVSSNVAVEVPLRWISPYLEYSIEIPLAYPTTFASTVVIEPSGLAPKQVELASEPERPPFARMMPQRITPGVRVTALRDFTFDAAVEIGLTPETTLGVPPVAPYTVIFLASYALDPFRTREAAGASGPPVSVPVIMAGGSGENGGRLAGTVKDEESGAPIEGAIVRFDRSTPVATDAEGRFVSAGMEPGPLTVVVSRAGYEDGTAELDLPEDRVDVEVALAPSTLAGVITGQVRGPSGPVSGALVTAEGPESAEVTTGEDGRFEIPLPQGEYRVVARSGGLLASGAVVTVARGERPTVALRVQPAAETAQIEDGRLRLGAPILFPEASSSLTEASKNLLARATDYLLRNPSSRIRIEGHAADVGEIGALSRLSQDRAESVRDFLVAQGVSSDRLDLAAFGAQKPVAPNATLRGRAQNDRVELIVIGGGEDSAEEAEEFEEFEDGDDEDEADDEDFETGGE